MSLANSVSRIGQDCSRTAKKKLRKCLKCIASGEILRITNFPPKIYIEDNIPIKQFKKIPKNE